MRAKLQRTETELRSVREGAAAVAARATELETAVAQKDLQLGAAAQQVTLMQHELEALRRGLSGRQAAAMEAARGEYAAALDNCRAELEAAQRRASDSTLAAQRQGKALAAVLRILAVHAGEEPGSIGAGDAAAKANQAGSGAAAAGPDPDKAVAFAEAVSGSMLEEQQAWAEERAELGAALEAAEAVHGQLESLLERERGDNRAMTGELAELRGAAAELEAQLGEAQQLVAEVGWRVGGCDGGQDWNGQEKKSVVATFTAACLSHFPVGRSLGPPRRHTLLPTARWRPAAASWRQPPPRQRQRLMRRPSGRARRARWRRVCRR